MRNINHKKGNIVQATYSSSLYNILLIIVFIVPCFFGIILCNFISEVPNPWLWPTTGSCPTWNWAVWVAGWSMCACACSSVCPCVSLAGIHTPACWPDAQESWAVCVRASPPLVQGLRGRTCACWPATHVAQFPHPQAAKLQTLETAALYSHHYFLFIFSLSLNSSTSFFHQSFFHIRLLTFLWHFITYFCSNHFIRCLPYVHFLLILLED